MIIRLTSFISLILTLATPPGWSRTFTSADGRTLEGEITARQGDQVTIRRIPDGREFTLPVAALSKPDQEAVSKWAPPAPGAPKAPAGDAAPKALGKITVSASKDRLSNQKTSTGNGSYRMEDAKVQNWCWNITIKNGSPAPLTGLSLKYRQVVERTNRNGGSSKRIVRDGSSSMSVPDIKPFGSVTIKTNDITVLAWKASSISTRTNSSGDKTTTITSSKWDESLSGLGVELFQDDLKITDWKTGTDPGSVPAPRP